MPTGIYNRKKAKFNKGMFQKGINYYPEYKRNCLGKKFPNRKRINQNQEGENNSAWKGGKVKHLGYIKIYQPNHPFADKGKYVREHRLVLEKHLNRYLLPNEQVHHLGTREDNDIHNLMLFNSFNAHMRFEKKQKVLDIEIIFDGRKLKP